MSGVLSWHSFLLHVGDQFIFASSDVLSDITQFSYNNTVYACSHNFLLAVDILLYGRRKIIKLRKEQVEKSLFMWN